jgi:hypothetical protein
MLGHARIFFTGHLKVHNDILPSFPGFPGSRGSLFLTRLRPVPTEIDRIDRTGAFSLE